MLSFFPTVKSISERGLAEQVVKPEDFYDDNDMLICGVCKEPRQEIREFPDPTDQEPERKTPLKVTRMCKCDREREAEKKRQEQLEKDMKRIQYLKSISLIEEKYASAKFEDLTVNNYNRRNVKLAMRYCETFEKMFEKNQGLMFWGGVGTGKSYLAACIANALLERKIPVVMTSLVKFLERIDKNRDEESIIISRLESAKLVIFDDLGAERKTSYALEKIYNIIDSRYLSGKPMIITTNLSLEEMKKETDIEYSRIYDRIFEVCFPMQFTGTSWRRVNANKRFTEVENFLLGNEE